VEVHRRWLVAAQGHLFLRTRVEAPLDVRGDVKVLVIDGAEQ